MPRPPRPEKQEPKIWRYQLPGGWVVLAGRNDEDNDQLSLKIARANDYWFHVKGLPGSHVVLRVQKPSKPVPDAVVYKCAQLAAYYSGARESLKVPVDYTRVKNVRKVKGQKTGKVFYTNEKTLFAKPSPLTEMAQL